MTDPVEYWSKRLPEAVFGKPGQVFGDRSYTPYGLQLGSASDGRTLFGVGLIRRDGDKLTATIENLRATPRENLGLAIAPHVVAIWIKDGPDDHRNPLEPM